MTLPTDVNSSPNYTAAEHATHHNTIHAAVNTAPTTAPVIISEQTLAIATAHIEFSSIPTTYKHLRIEGRVRGDAAGVTQVYLCVRVGSSGTVDTGSNYRAVAVREGTVDYNSTGRAEFIPCKAHAATADADTWSWFEVTIEDYLTTTYWRLMHGRAQVHTTSSETGFWEGLGHWKNKTNAIDVVRVYPLTGNWIAGTRMRLIGQP